MLNVWHLVAPSTVNGDANATRGYRAITATSSINVAPYQNTTIQIDVDFSWGSVTEGMLSVSC